MRLLTAVCLGLVAMWPTGAHAESVAPATCQQLIGKVNACVPGAAYTDEAIGSCANDLEKHSAGCQQLAAALMGCEQGISCNQFLQSESSECVAHYTAYVLACGDPAQSPAELDEDSPATHSPTFRSISFHLRATRRLFGL